MECHCIRPGELPHATKLFATFLGDFEQVSEYYAHPPSAEGILRAARAVADDAGDQQRVTRAVVEVLREQNRRLGADGATERNLDRLAAGAVAIVTGQQVGLFTGPSYSIYKAITALRVAAELTEKGIEAVPVFWLATEDHDLAEVNHCFWPGRTGLERLEISPPDAAGRHVGEVQLGEAARTVVPAAAGALDGPFAEEIAQALDESYRPAETFGSAFGKLLARLFAGQGIVLLDPLDSRLHRQAATMYCRAAEENAAVVADLMARSKKLERDGFHAQVKVAERNTLLFINIEGHRLPVRSRNDGFVAGTAHFSAAELCAAIERTPEAFSPNVLLRPVVQDALLPTAAYVAGPAEIAYFAQAEVVYRRLRGRMPAIVPRAGFTLIEPHAARLLKKYSLELSDVLHGRQVLRVKMERQYLSKDLGRRFTAGETTIRKLLDGLRPHLAKLDSTLANGMDATERKMLYQFLRLRGKAGRAENFRTGVLDAHEQQLRNALFPHHGLQERAMCFLPLLARHGPPLLEELGRRATTAQFQHQVLFL